MCPTLSWWGFITLISVIEVIVYIISLRINGLDDSLFLAPSSKTLSYVWSDPKKIKKEWQLFRFLTPTFFHGSLEHLVGNIVFQFFVGSGIE